MQSRSARYSLGRIFAWPIVFAVLSGLGLVSALLGDNLWDWLSWLALAAPLIAIAWFWTIRTRTRRRAYGAARLSTP
jgi:hypothetical protein